MSTAGKPKYDNNYLTTENGCFIIECSSEHQRGPASSIIQPDSKSVWVTTEKLPQQCTISLRKLTKKPPNSIFNFIGFYCWHQYDSNPALIELWAKLGQRQKQKWHLVSKIRLSMNDNWQYFKIEDLAVEKLKDIKIKIIENFGDTKSYLNKVALHYVNPKEMSNIKMESHSIAQQQNISHNNSHQNNAISPHTIFARNKIQSQYHPSTNSNKDVEHLQKQLKKANDRIFYLSQQQQSMKKTMLQQQKIIIKIQETLKSVLHNMEKMQNIQELKSQVKDFVPNQNINSKEKSKGKSKKKYEQEQDEDIEQDGRTSNQIENLRKMLNKMEKQTLLNAPPSKSSSKPRPHSNSNNKLSQVYFSQVNDIIKTNSQQDLSEYSPHYGHYTVNNNYKTSQASQSKDIYVSNRSKTKGDKAMMLDRLKKLLDLKQKKKLELKKSAAKGSTHNSHNQSKKKKIQNYQEEDDDMEGMMEYQTNYGEDKHRKSYGHYY